MPLEVKIGGDGASLTIEVMGYEDSSAQNISDANWLSCRVIIAIGEGVFSSDFPASFTTYDFAQFREQLDTALSKLSGMASFLTDEDALRLNIELGKTGSAHVEGLAGIYGQPQAVLSFSFETDQSFLSQTLHALGTVVTHFPAKQRIL